MLFRYFLQLAYKGTHFHGWQIQPNAETVQSHVNKTLSILLHENIETTGAGRTDSGVHARYFIAHFDSQQPDLHKNNSLIHQINSILPHDIALQKIFRVNNDAHARFDAISRTYEYYISRVKDPFIREYSYYLSGTLDREKMNEAAGILFEYTDFTSFSKLHSDAGTNNCRIIEAGWDTVDSGIRFVIKADRFLRNMVRAIVGTLIDVGRNKITLIDFRDIIEQKDRGRAGYSVPAQGLFLTEIKYPYKLNNY